MPSRKAKQATPPASQPMPKQPTRAAGRKRRASDASSVVSEPAASRQINIDGPAKKRKKGRPTRKSVEPEVIPEGCEEDADLEAHHQQLQLGGDATYEHEPEAATGSIEVLQTKSKHVQFRSSLVGLGGDRTTATTTTPHPRKTISAYKRRVTASPALSRRAHTYVSRNSLPAELPQGEDGAPGSTTAGKIIKEYQFSPLRTVLDERIRRRLRRSHLSEEQNAIDDHEKRDSRTAQELQALREEAAQKERHIAELEEELELQRQAAIDITEEEDSEQKIIQLEQQLAASRRALAEYTSTHRVGDVDMHEPEDIAVFDSQEDVGPAPYPVLPTPGPSQQPSFNRSLIRSQSGDAKEDLPEIRESTGRVSSTLITLQDAWEKERQDYRDAIEVFSKEAGEARAQLKILQIELEAMGFGGPEVESEVILRSIRQSFTNIRETIEENLPDTLPEGARTQDVVEIFIANVSEFQQRLKQYDFDSLQKDILAADLGNQVQTLLDHLAAAEISKSELVQRFDQVDRENEDHSREAEELEEELRAVEAERDGLKEQLAEKVEEARTLGEDHAETIGNLEKLNVSLENYRLEETRLQEMITRMEEDHRESVRRMNAEREETIQEMDEKLDDEAMKRVEAEKLADERETSITELQLKVEELCGERDALTTELEEVRAERDTEFAGRETAEIQLGERNAEVEDLETRIDSLEEELEVLNNDIIQLRKSAEQESQQREAAEADLDDRNAELETLNQRLKDMGKEANELRTQIFGLQQEQAAKVEELEGQMSERDVQYQTDMAAEVERREGVEELAQQRAATIVDLERQLEELQTEMRVVVDEKDERIASLEIDIADRDSEIEGLKMDLRSVESERDNEHEANEDRIEELEGSIAALQQTISEHEATIQKMQTEAVNTTELHNSEIEDRNAQIADLHEQVRQLRMEANELQHRNSGLEKRVEQEAEAMLELQNAKEDEIDDLKAQLSDKQNKILKVEEKAREADLQWQEVLDARDAELSEVRARGEEHEEVIETSAIEFTAHKDRFRTYVERTNTTLANLRAQLAAAQGVATDEAEELRLDGNRALEELERIDVVGEMKRTTVVRTAAPSSQATGGAVTKKGRGVRKSKRVMDSGIGMDDEEMMA